MYCPNCGKEVKPTDKFCPYCGARLIKEETPEEKELKRARADLFSNVMNKILCIASFFVVLMAVIGVFGPTISYSNYIDYSRLEIGGIYWFISTGYEMLNQGAISVGPYYLTLVLYIASSISIILLGAYMVYKSINDLRNNAKFSSYPLFFLMVFIRRIYVALVENFYYEYIENTGGYLEAGSGWGETAFEVGIPLFIIALIVYLIGRVSFSKDSKKIGTVVMLLIPSLLLLGQFSNMFTILGFRDYHINETVLYGTLHYFDAFQGEAPMNVVITVLVAFALGILATITIVAYIVSTIRKVIKGENINRRLVLILAILLNVFSFGMLASSIVFSFNVNNVPGFYDNAFYLNGSISGFCFTSLVVLGLSIAVYTMNVDMEDNDSNIIDQEVEFKEE